MASFSAGTTFTDGVANDVTAAKLAALVNAATPTSGLIQDRTAELTIAADDTLLFGDFSDFSNLKRMTVANFAGTLPTATITTLNSTTGTITTLNSTTGTIPTLVATTLITTGTGTAAAPAIVPTGDTNTGIFFPAADTIAFSEGGAEAVRINSLGNFGIGIDPSSKLHVVANQNNCAYTSSGTTQHQLSTVLNGNNANLYYGVEGSSTGRTDVNGTLDNASYFGSRTAHPVQFISNNSARMTIDSSGNVGIGTSSPAGNLHVVGVSGTTIIRAVGADSQGNADAEIFSTGSAGNSRLYFSDTAAQSGSIIYSHNTNSFAFATAGTERLRIDSGGNFGIGNTSPSSYNASGDNLVVGNTGDNGITIVSGANGNGYIFFADGVSGTNAYAGQVDFDHSVNALKFGVLGTERLRITSDGYLKASNTGTYVNSAAAFHEIRSDSSGNEALVLSNSATTAPYGMQIRFTATPNDATSTFLSCNDGNGTTIRADLRSNGGFRNYQANDANLSDERLKKDIIASPNYLEKICSIPVVNFKYKDQTHDDYNLGVIAQQLEAVCPELVDADGFGETPVDGIPIKTIYQTDLQYALMKCIQEQQVIINELKTKVSALEAA